ncbi:MAG: ThiF family adenylyltransferase, partial [Candidatus Neomarinimicrobiota bacterium]
VGSLLFSPQNFHGRIWLGDKKVQDMSHLTVIGRSISRIDLEQSGSAEILGNREKFSRQIKAFGDKGQQVLSSARVGIVGLGGTGSATAEQLVRMGVQELALIDKDIFEESNITRVFGCFSEDIGTNEQARLENISLAVPKVEVIGKHLLRINPEANIRTIHGNVASSIVCNELLNCDVIFSCMDAHWGRSIINQIAYQYLIPCIDMGTRIDSRDGTILGAAGNVRMLMPGKPCLWCTDFLNADRIMAESIPKSSRGALIREGYVDDPDTIAPSVISLNTTVSSLSVTMFLQLLTDFMGANGDISILKYFITEGVISRGKASIKDDCICGKVRGFGDYYPLPVTRDTD